MNRDGRSRDGIAYIRKMIDLAQKPYRSDMIFKGYVETIYFGVKTGDVPLMREYINNAREIEDYAINDLEQGVLLRLEALCDIRHGRYDSAEKLLFQSIDLLEGPRYKGVSYNNVAAAYDYLGLIYRNQKKYEQSRIYLEKAIQLCKDRTLKKGLDLFYTDLGYTLFLEGKLEEAKKNFIISAELYTTFNEYWLRSIGESCMAMICIREGDMKKALGYFRKAEIFSQKDRIAEEMRVLNLARKELKEHKVL